MAGEKKSRDEIYDASDLTGEGASTHNLRSLLREELESIVGSQVRASNFVDITLRGSDGYVSIIQPLNRPGAYGTDFIVDLKDNTNSRKARLIVESQGQHKGKVNFYGKPGPLSEEGERRCLEFLNTTVNRFHGLVLKKKAVPQASDYDLVKDEAYSLNDGMTKLPSEIFVQEEIKPQS